MICEKTTDVDMIVYYMCENLGIEPPLQMPPVATSGVFSTFDYARRLYHLMYTCEERSNGLKDLDTYFSKSIDVLPFDKKLPRSMIA